MDAWDTDSNTKITRVTRSYNVYRGNSPSTQNRLEVSSGVPTCLGFQMTKYQVDRTSALKWNMFAKCVFVTIVLFVLYFV